MAEYETVIGLEVHAQLLTHSKMFCACRNEFGALPNSLTCPVCLGMPGVLPVVNKTALEHSVKTALALNCQVRDFTKFDRKNYYYPDLPKNYQISQYDLPLAYEGHIDIELGDTVKRIGITRAHMEEDAGKLIHKEDGSASLVDLNRAGVPLLEIVSEPDIASPEEAFEYLTELKLLLTYLNVCDCNMQEGSLRCDANISVRPKGQKEFGVKVEVKNMNSFNGVKNALIFERDRQTALCEAGRKDEITHETRLWDDSKGETRPMRSKERAHDYRYFPEPDLPPLRLTQEYIQKMRDSLCELPFAMRKRYRDAYGLSAYDAKVIVSDKAAPRYFEECLAIGIPAKEAANWLINQVFAEVNNRNITLDTFPIRPAQLKSLTDLVTSGKLTNKMARDIFPKMLDTGKTPDVLMNELGLKVVGGEDELRSMIMEELGKNPNAIADYCKGKEKSFGFFMGQVMRRTKNQADGQLLQKILREELDKHKNS